MNSKCRSSSWQWNFKISGFLEQQTVLRIHMIICLSCSPRDPTSDKRKKMRWDEMRWDDNLRHENTIAVAIVKYNVEFWLLFSAHYHINLYSLTENAFVIVVRWKWKKCMFMWPATEKDNDLKIYVTELYPIWMIVELASKHWSMYMPRIRAQGFLDFHPCRCRLPW